MFNDFSNSEILLAGIFSGSSGNSVKDISSVKIVEFYAFKFSMRTLSLFSRIDSNEFSSFIGKLL